MGPGVSLPLWTAVTVFTCFQVPPRVWWGECFLVVGCESWVILGVVWLRAALVCVVSFRPVSASSLRPLLVF